MIAEGINPALADQLVAIEQNFDAERKIVDERIASLETTLLQADADAEVTKELKKQLDLLKKKREELDGAEGKAKDNAKDKEDPGKIEQYIKQLETELADFEGMVVSLAQTIESELAGAMSNAITGIIDGTMTAEEAFANMFKNIGKAFIDMATQMIAKALIMKALGILFPGASSGGGLIGSSGGWTLPDAATPKFSGGNMFSGGGYTGNGPRSGGVDGQGGFPAILHPQETVIDHTKSKNAMSTYSPANSVKMDAQMAPANYNFNTIRIADEEYVSREQLTSAMRQASYEGAKKGEAMTLSRLQNSRSSRQKLGL